MEAMALLEIGEVPSWKEAGTDEVRRGLLGKTRATFVGAVDRYSPTAGLTCDGGGNRPWLFIDIVYGGIASSLVFVVIESYGAAPLSITGVEISAPGTGDFKRSLSSCCPARTPHSSRSRSRSRWCPRQR